MDYDINENENYSKVFIDELKLNRLPVAVKFINDESEVPEGIDKIDESLRHCEMITKAAKGESFYSTAEEQRCAGGASAMGLIDLPPKIASGELYYNLGRFESIETAKSVLDNIYRKDERSFGIVYAPLEKANFAPDVVVVIANPKYGMRITQAIVYNSGEMFNAKFAGIQSLCADAVSGPYVSGKPNATLACSGSRAYAGIEDEEIAYGMHRDNIKPIIEAFANMK